MTPPFRFKQFAVQQEQVAMKVGTDGILLGAWADVDGAETLLDVGTGSGLIALMLAQRTALQSDTFAERSPPRIHAIDIDASAYHDAFVNTQQSPWPERLKVYHSSVQDHSLLFPRHYDLIVSNPPYFVGSLKASAPSRNSARHDTLLPFDVLCQTTVRMLKPNGRLCVTLPAARYSECSLTARDFGLFNRKCCWVKPLPHKAPKRVLLEFQLVQGPCATKELTVEMERHVYTDAFKALTGAFYTYSWA